MMNCENKPYIDLFKQLIQRAALLSISSHLTQVPQFHPDENADGTA